MDLLDRETRLAYHTAIHFLLEHVGDYLLTDPKDDAQRQDIATFEKIKEEHSWDGLSCACGGGWLAGHLAGCPEAMADRDVVREYPNEMTDDITWILGRPNFACAPIAHALRAAGDMKIETRGEAEQAHVIHWLLKMALDHPEDWRKRVGDRLDEIAAAKRKEST